MRKRVVLKNVSIEQANALRRSLIADVPMIAPHEVLIEVNTSSHTDEYIAQRIGLVPFTQNVRDDEKILHATINVSGRNLYGRDFQGSNCRATCDDNVVIPMLAGQELRAVVSFCRGTGSTHARFQRTVGVGMYSPSATENVIEFETLSGDDHAVCVKYALQALRERLLKARRDVAANVVRGVFA